MIKLMTSEASDCHMHTITYSDGLNSVDEMVMWAGLFDMHKIVITDHCQFYLDRSGYGKKSNRNIAGRYRNIHNDVEVIFGIEADIMNDEGDVSMDIQGIPADFTILSAHNHIFAGNPTKITEAYLRAIERFGDKITFLGHLCSKYFEKYLDVEKVVDAALACGVSFELNCANLRNSRTNLNNLKIMMSKSDRLWVNSDAHTLEELKNLRRVGYEFLEDNHFLP